MAVHTMLESNTITSLGLHSDWPDFGRSTEELTRAPSTQVRTPGSRRRAPRPAATRRTPPRIGTLPSLLGSDVRETRNEQKPRAMSIHRCRRRRSPANRIIPSDLQFGVAPPPRRPSRATRSAMRCTGRRDDATPSCRATAPGFRGTGTPQLQLQLPGPLRASARRAPMRDRLDVLVAVGDGDPSLASAPHQDRLVEPAT